MALRDLKQELEDWKALLFITPEQAAKLKAKGFEDGGMVVKDKIVSIDTSPNSGLITVKGFGASRRT